uniref:uncharacterized protein isoform X3 n=1 Tax=Myxine glutinosa TaxID=7769 RepID=UPI00358DEC67
MVRSAFFQLRQHNTSRIQITLKTPFKIAVRPVVNLTCFKQHQIGIGLCGCCDKNGYGAWSLALKPTSGPELNVTCKFSDTTRLICTWPSAVKANTSYFPSKVMYRWKKGENRSWEECKEYIQETGFEISGCVWHNVLYPNKLKLDVQMPHFLQYHTSFKLEKKYNPEPPSRLWLELKDGKPDDVCNSSNNMVDIQGTMKTEAEDWEVAILCWKLPVLPNINYVYEVNITPKDGGNKQTFRKLYGVGFRIKPFNPSRSYTMSVRRKHSQLNNWSAWSTFEYNANNDTGQKWWQKLILAALVPIILCGLCILTIHVSRHRLLRLKTKLWPDIPDPSRLFDGLSTLSQFEMRKPDHLGSLLEPTKSESTHFIEELKDNVWNNTQPSLKAPLQNEPLEQCVPEQYREKASNFLGETDKKTLTIDLPSSTCMQGGNLQYCLLESMNVDTQGEPIFTCFGKNTDTRVSCLIPIEPT